MLSAFRAAQLPSVKILEGVRTAFLLFNLVGFVMYPIELYFVGHWLDSFGSRMPFLVSVPGLILTVAILFNRRNPYIYWTFIAVMVLAAATGVAGFLFHMMYNFEGEVDWSFMAATRALEGSRPVLAALAYTHIGLTGLLCAYRAR
jgi:hypothetical protein